jgi:Flp pilus assembly protein TadG
MGEALPEAVTNSVMAYYWDGAAPVPHSVRNLGPHGATIITAEKWYPGTVIHLTLQHGAHMNGAVDKQVSVSVRARVVAQDVDGVRVVFVCLNNQERHTLRKFLHDLQLAQPTVSPRSMSASSGGNSLVEFALILPLILLLVVNIVNFGAFMYAWITVSNAARAGGQYMILGGASVGFPPEATAAQISTIITNDVKTLPNAASVVVRVCTDNNGTWKQVSGGTTACSAGNTDGFSDPEPTSYVLATVDVTYTYQPLIPLWEFPKLGIHATLPPTTVHRTAVMRMIQ